MLNYYQKIKDHNSSLQFVLHLLAVFLPHQHFEKRCRQFSWLQRFLHYSVLIFSFSKEEERSPEGRGVSARSTENLPCWGLGTAGHTHEEAAGWVSEAAGADRKVSSNNQDRRKRCLGLFIWHISKLLLNSRDCQTFWVWADTAEFFDTIECILGVVLLCWFFVSSCAFRTGHTLYMSASFANSHLTFKHC